METLRVSHSSLATFASCPRKFEFNKLYPKRDRVQEDTYVMDTGSALHAGYQDYLSHKDRDRAIWEFMQQFPYEAEFSQKNDFRSFEACLSTLEEMFDCLKMEEYELVRIKKPDGSIVPAIEVPFEIRFPGFVIPPCPIFPEGAELSLIGYIDAIMQHQLTQRYRSVDIKTSRMNLADATGKYMFDGQQVPYGIVIDHVAEGAVDAFEVVYLESYIDILEPRITPYQFIKRRDDVQEWAMNKLIQFQQIAQFCASDFFPRTDTGCLFYNHPCKYLEPCQSRDREALITWFMLGEEPTRQREEFVPWIVGDVNVGG